MRFKCLVILVLALFVGGCNRSGSETANTAPSPEASPLPTVQSSPLTDFEEALRFVRNGQFTYVWIISRKDGKPFNSEDGAIIRAKTSHVVDRTMTKDGKKIVAGSNFPFEEQNLAELKKRYVIEDYSAK